MATILDISPGPLTEIKGAWPVPDGPYWSAFTTKDSDNGGIWYLWEGQIYDEQGFIQSAPFTWKGARCVPFAPVLRRYLYQRLCPKS